MIGSFADKATEELFLRGRHKLLGTSSRSALRKLKQLDAAGNLIDLRVPPGNRLEALKGTRSGQYSIRVNDQYRVCFYWRDGQADDVEIVDYH